MDVLRIDVVDGVLKVDGRKALIPVDDRTFLFEPLPAVRVVFQVDAAGRVGGVHWIDSDGPTDFDRVEPVVMGARRACTRAATSRRRRRLRSP